MTDLIPIRRELLEQVAAEFEHDNDRYMLGRELRKVLDTPRQPEGVVRVVQAQRAIAELQAKLDVVGAVTGEDEMLSDALADIATHDKK